jgi:hypothetical protein
MKCGFEMEVKWRDSEYQHDLVNDGKTTGATWHKVFSRTGSHGQTTGIGYTRDLAFH